MKKSVLLLLLILISVLLCACTPVGGEVTTEALTDSSPETSAVSPETTQAETEAETTAEVTTEKIPETTEPPSPTEVRVYVYDALGNAKEYVIKSETLTSAALESVDLAVGEDVRAELLGWEYSIAKDGERKPYDVNDPPFVTFEGMHIYPVLEYSYRVRFLAGDGRFAEGAQTEFFVKAGDKVSAEDLLSVMPEKADGDATVYEFAGFSYDGGDLSAKTKFTVDRAMIFTALYLERDAVYTVSVRTEYGELPSGGKTAEFTGNLADADKFVSRYINYDYPDVRVGGSLYQVSETALKKNGRSWILDIEWKCVSVGFTLVFDYGDGQQAVHSALTENEVIILPILERREDNERYYDFVGWRDVRGHLYNGGYGLTVSEDMTFTAEYAAGARRVYTVVFDTEIGNFPNGSPVIVIEGYYGDPLVPPTPPESGELTFGEVVYEFVGWSADIPSVIDRDMSFTAIYKTEKTVYYLNFYIDGEIYLTVPHYASAPLVMPEAPQISDRVFSGWDGMPQIMPEHDLDLYATTRDPEVIYVLDGEEISLIPTRYGTLVTLADAPRKAGFTVSGWTTSDISGLDGNSFSMPAHDVRFSASSVPNRHTVKYVVDGAEIYSDSVAYGDIYTVRGIEVKIGHTFAGWVRSDAATGEQIAVFAIPDQDLTFIGSFSKNEYKVNYYIDGEILYSDSYFYGDTVLLRPDEEQQGCIFAWHSAGADLVPGTFTMPAEDVDVYGIFSSGDNYIFFTIDGIEYGSIRVNAGERIDLGFLPTKQGYAFSGWSCDELDVGGGVFIMPEGDIVLRGSFIPDAHDIYFIDIETETVINTSHLDYGSRFSLGDSIFCLAGRVSDGWVLLSGDVLPFEDGYVMPDSDVVFGIVWNECLTLEVEEGYHVPYYAVGDEYYGCRYDEALRTVYITDPAVKAYGASEGVAVVYEYEAQ